MALGGNSSRASPLAQRQSQHVGMQELGSVEEALEQARVALQERDFLIVAHERSEDALASHALELTSRLDVACGDVTSLAERCADDVGVICGDGGGMGGWRKLQFFWGWGSCVNVSVCVHLEHQQ